MPTKTWAWHPKTGTLHLVAGLILALLLLTGCGEQNDKLPTGYGKRTGQHISSVNGTRALSEMFREAGYYARSYQQITPGMLRHDVIVWVPDAFTGPSQEMRNIILDWLEAEDGRTFIYVGRDFDASIQYWDEMIHQLPPSSKLDAIRQRSQAVQRFDMLRNNQEESADYLWFTTKRDVPRRMPREFSGPWAEAVDASKTEIVLRSKIDPASADKFYEQMDEEDAPVYLIEDAEVLLESGDEPIVVRLGSEYSESQIILVNNGSFLLNLPLVNPEHRKLAGKLINECDSIYGPESVAFLETGDYVRILSADDSAAGTSGWEWLEQWPLNMVGLQMAWWLIVLCFALYPIFGRAKRLPASSTSDFKKHIDSVGDLLEATDDHGYAQLRLQQYQQIMKGDAVYRRSRTRRGEGK